MSWLFPSVFAIGGAAAALTVALHWIARSRPVAEPLPTARFVPQPPVQARSRSTAPSDLWLLVIRVAAIAALTAGVAGPVLSSRGRIARVIVVDRSRGVASPAEARDSALAYARLGDHLVVFDSAARRSVATLDSVTLTTARGSLSVALAAGIRVAASDAERADSIEFVLISPFSQEEIDDATFKIRDAWPGRIRVVPVAAAAPILEGGRLEVIASPNDAVAAGLSLMGLTTGPAVRLVRNAPSAADSAWARIGGHVLVLWPQDSAGVSWPRRPFVDTVGAVTANGAVLVGDFPRWWSPEGRPVARWSDGEAAAVEDRLGDGCTRRVAIRIDGSSDITLHWPFRAFVAALIAPCGGSRVTDRIGAPALASLAGPSRLAAAAGLRDPATAVSRATPWLLLLGTALLIAELAVRRGARPLS